MNVTWPGRRIYGFGRGKGMRPGDYGRCQIGLWWVAAPLQHLLPVTWWTVWKGGCIAQMRDENLLKSLHEMPDKKLDPWMVIGCSIGAVLGLWLVWCLAVWGSRFTVWMGTEAKVWPW